MLCKYHMDRVVSKLLLFLIPGPELLLHIPCQLLGFFYPCHCNFRSSEIYHCNFFELHHITTGHRPNRIHGIRRATHGKTLLARSSISRRPDEFSPHDYLSELQFGLSSKAYSTISASVHFSFVYCFADLDSTIFFNQKFGNLHIST